MPTQRAPELPRIPSLTAWPLTVRSAETLRGTLVRCGPGVRLAAWPETARVRAAALEPWFHQHRVAIRLTAAWIWGATRNPGTPLRFATQNGRRAEPVNRALVTLQQLRFHEGEIEQLGDHAVTSPLRTLLDLLRDPDPLPHEARVACRLLIPLVPGGEAAVEAHLSVGAHPYRKVALHRLRGR